MNDKSLNDALHRRFWEAASRSICRQINTGFCLQLFLPILLILTVIQGCLLLLLRKMDTPQLSFWLGYGIVVLIVLGVSIWGSRHRFFSLADGFVYLEVKLLLNNRLSAARQGHGAWPGPRALPKSLRWSWQRLALPPVMASAFLLLAGWVPLTQKAIAPFQAPEEPLAWQQIESWAETLKDRELFDDESLAQWKEQVQSLRDQQPEDWYSHSSLEAGDNLRENAADAIRHLQNALEKAAFPLTLARDSLDQMPSGLQPLLQEHWLEALAQLGSGPLTLNKETLAQLREVDFGNLQTLSRDQIDRLEKMLREGQEACNTCMGHGTCDGEGKPCGTCPGGVCTGGSWGIGKGPGPADLTFREFPNLLDSQRQEAVSNLDLSRAALGQQLGTTQSAPEVDLDSDRQITAAGEANLAGEGGEAVFHSRLTPAEQRRLQQYFQ